MIEKISKILLLALVCHCMACSENTSVTSGEFQGFTALSPAQTGIDFENFVDEHPQRSIAFYDYFYNGSGVAAGDFNNDGLPDLFFAGADATNTLYLNEGDLKFKDISQKAGIIADNRWSTGVTLVDINTDGWLDIYVSNSGPTNDLNKLRNQLFVNNKNNTFTERAAEYGLDSPGRTTQAVFFDIDRDGDLDFFMINHALRNLGSGYSEWAETYNSKPVEEKKLMTNQLYRNDGGEFVDISRSAGVDKPGFGLGVAIFDVDEDGWLDIYVANDYFIPDFLLLNNKNGTFTDQIKNKMPHTSYYAMGCDAADYNNDGLTDLAVVDMTPGDHFRNKTLMASMNVKGFELLTDDLGYAPQYMFNSLHVNRGGGIFSDAAQLAGIPQTDWSWAALLADLDNDGWKDFIVSNGFLRDTKDNDWQAAVARRRAQPNYTPEAYFEILQQAASVPISNFVFQNNQKLGFVDKTQDWGMAAPSFSQGTVYADLDADGDLDLVFNNLKEKAFVYRNNASENKSANWIQFSLSDGKSLNDVLFSKVKIHHEGGIQEVDYQFTRGYQSFVEPLAHFGLGKLTHIEKVEVTWPDGKMTVLENPAINKRHTISKNGATLPPLQESQAGDAIVNIISKVPALQFQHTENKYDDFATEILLPHRQSRLGPGAAVGDVNGDGLEDAFIGGAKGQAGILVLQHSTEIFVPSPQPALEADAGSEDTGATFFDYDADGDLDLYVCSGGGGDFLGNSPQLQDRLYRNDNGQFVKTTALPAMLESTMAVAPFDYDGDGDQDLLVGGRTTPGAYPLAPQSYLLENDNGQFSDVTAEKAPQLEQIGMITDILWNDFNGDSQMDFMIAGEWMPLTIFTQNNGQWQIDNNYGFDQTSGWWFSLTQGDVDNDGDLDIVAGNIGLNNKFHPSVEKPLMLFGNDFDGNGTLDIVLSKYYEGEPVPVRGKECSTQQMPYLAEKFPTYAGFASSSLEDIYGSDKLNDATQLGAQTFASVWIENLGNGQYSIHELPPEAQLSPINGCMIEDLNQDGFNDLFLAGNLFETEVETASYDAGKGLLMLGTEDKTFDISLNMATYGLFLPYDTKQLIPIRVGDQQIQGAIIANNNGPLQCVLVRPKFFAQ